MKEEKNNLSTVEYGCLAHDEEMKEKEKGKHKGGMVQGIPYICHNNPTSKVIYY